jgi:hypothetical protein
VVDGIDAAHGSLASLFFNYERNKSWRARDHENAIERGGVHSQIADSAVHIDKQGLSLPPRTTFRRRAPSSYARHQHRLRVPVRADVLCEGPWREAMTFANALETTRSSFLALRQFTNQFANSRL